MTAAALVAELRALGVELAPAGDRLRFRPASRVPPDLLARLRERKAEVLALLAEDSLAPARAWSGYSYPWPDSLSALGVRHVGPFDQCADCERWSWVRYGSVVLCLACACRLATGPVA